MARPPLTPCQPRKDYPRGWPESPRPPARLPSAGHLVPADSPVAPQGYLGGQRPAAGQRDVAAELPTAAGRGGERAVRRRGHDGVVLVLARAEVLRPGADQ